MRELKFRAVSQDSNKFVFGNLVDDGMKDKSYYILPPNADNYDEIIGVISNTIGQYTGLKDRNWKEIYEGDILSYKEAYPDDEEQPFYVYWIDSMACFGIMYKSWDKETYVRFDRFYYTHGTVIGNIHENPEPP